MAATTPEHRGTGEVSPVLDVLPSIPPLHNRRSERKERDRVRDVSQSTGESFPASPVPSMIAPHGCAGPACGYPGCPRTGPPGSATEGIDLDEILGPACSSCGRRLGHAPGCEASQ